MKSCNCTLPYFNGPDVCNGCPNNTEDFIDNSTYPWSPLTNPNEQYPKTKTIKKVTKTVEKFDKNGNFIGKEVITEEYEDQEVQVWEPNRWEIWGSGTTNPEMSQYNHCTSVDINLGQGTISCIN